MNKKEQIILEDAAKHYAYIDWSSDEDIFAFEIKKYDAFIAGAEWQKEQDLKEMAQSKSPLSVAYANRCFENGKQAMKEQMMKDGNVILAEEDFNAEKEKSIEWGYNLCKQQMLKDAVEATVTTNLANRPIIYLDQLHGFEYGDKVRIIIVKEDEK